jgi:hypothetical protein
MAMRGGARAGAGRPRKSVDHSVGCRRMTVRNDGDIDDLARRLRALGQPALVIVLEMSDIEEMLDDMAGRAERPKLNLGGISTVDTPPAHPTSVKRRVFRQVDTSAITAAPAAALSSRRTH